jgi:hypothetical protein
MAIAIRVCYKQYQHRKSHHTQHKVNASGVNKLNIRMRGRRNTDDTQHQEPLQHDGECRRRAFCTGMLAVGVVVRCACGVCGVVGGEWVRTTRVRTTRGHVRRVRPIRAHGWPAALPARVGQLPSPRGLAMMCHVVAHCCGASCANSTVIL